jgi:hypothetical protein
MGWLPAFSKDEVRLILEYARDRNSDENDTYNLYITDMPILESKYHIFIYDDKGILFYNAIPQLVQTSNSICIENHSLANLFSEYAETHIPAYHALSKEKATEYINSLIDIC